MAACFLFWGLKGGFFFQKEVVHCSRMQMEPAA